jgi:hypothetical protein
MGCQRVFKTGTEAKIVVRAEENLSRADQPGKFEKGALLVPWFCRTVGRGCSSLSYGDSHVLGQPPSLSDSQASKSLVSVITCWLN